MPDNPRYKVMQVLASVHTDDPHYWAWGVYDTVSKRTTRDYWVRRYPVVPEYVTNTVEALNSGVIRFHSMAWERGNSVREPVT